MTKSQRILKIMNLTKRLRNDADLPEDIVDYASMWAYSYPAIVVMMELIYNSDDMFEKMEHLSVLKDLLDELESDYEKEYGKVL